MKNLPAVLAKQSANTELNALILSISNTCKDIAKLLDRGALAGILGLAGEENVQGEAQKKLDVIADDMLIECLKNEPTCAGLASEEQDTSVALHSDGKFLVLFDPLDGSSNIDINMPVGTIFSILPRPNKNVTTGAVSDEEFLQAGRQQLAAGYVLYGPSTMLALTTGNGTHIYTLDPVSQIFLLTAENVQIPAETREFAINMSNQRFWEAPMQDYIAECLAGDTDVRGKNFNMRWVGAMVGDVHRILCRGGLFTYPFDKKDPSKAGKLRLMYEGNPMSLLVEQAGGQSTTARKPMLDIQPASLHQRVPVVLGSSEEVERVSELHRTFDAGQ